MGSPAASGIAIERSLWQQTSAKTCGPRTANKRWDVGIAMAYRIVATKEDQTLRSERQSLLIAAAKARVWASEGWEVVMTDCEGKIMKLTDLEKLFKTPEPKQESA